MSTQQAPDLISHYPTPKGTADMAYVHTNSNGERYYLHAKDVALKGGRLQRIYFFARTQQAGALDDVPAGYTVVENQRTGLPILKKQ